MILANSDTNNNHYDNEVKRYQNHLQNYASIYNIIKMIL